jgi:hypothetical protein
MAGQLRSFLGGYGADIQKRPNVRPEKCKRQLYSGKLSLGINENAGAKQKEQPDHQHPVGQDNNFRSLRNIWNRCYNLVLQIGRRMAGKPFVCRTGRYEQVYDLINAGPRHRFTVMGNNGPLIVHNCIQAIARDCLAESLMRVNTAGYQTVMHVHDEIILDVLEDTADLDRVCEIMGQPLPWASGLLLKADGFKTGFYKKE